MSPDDTSNLSPAVGFNIPRAILQSILAQADRERPNECCGILAGGRDGLVRRHYPLPNVLASPVEFESEPRATFEAAKDMRANGWDVLAVYHSHPSSPAVPSRKDLERSYGDSIVNLIVSQGEMRAWVYAAEGPHEVTFAVVGE